MKVFSHKSFVLFICICVILDINAVSAVKKYKINPVRCAAAAGVVAIGLPLVAGAAGFAAGGIGAGTFGSWLMSWSAIANGGGVPAGGLVAYLQSLGAAGLTSFATTGTGHALVVLGCLTQIEEDEC